MADESDCQESPSGHPQRGEPRSERLPGKLAAAWLHVPRSLTSRFIASLVVGVLLTSLAVTWISIQATESFLREKIDHKFVAALSETRQRLQLWHGERALEIESLARSTTLVRALAPSQKPNSSRANRYLSLVLEQLPQLEALFVLTEDGELHAWAGPERTLATPLRVELAGLSQTGVGDLLEDEAGRLHIASASILGDRDQRLGSVHALIRDTAFDELLQSERLGANGRIFVVGAEHEILAPRDTRASRPRYERPLLQIGDASRVTQYEADGGTAVIGGALAFPRFGWTLVVEEPYTDAFAPVVAIARRTAAINLAIVALFSSIAFLMARSIVRPIRALSVAANEIAAGHEDVAIPVSSRRDEIGLLSRALGEMTARLRQNQRELEEKNDALEHLAITDGLTGLYNQRYFQLQLEREMNRANRSKEPLSLILVDIDDFKKLNDTHGHALGDVSLKAVADAMRGVTRKSDLLARYGGEEFVLLSFGNRLEQAGEVAEKLRLAVSQVKIPASVGSKVEWIQMTVSVGVAEYRGDRDVFNQADRALYLAKDRGKDCVVMESEAG